MRQKGVSAGDYRDPNGTLPYEAARHCLYYRPERKCLTGAGAGPIGTGDVCELLNCTDDPWKLGPNGTDRGLYGGVYTGVLGAIVLPTSVADVPAFDLIATDPWPAADPPAAALSLYNPLTKRLNVTVTAPLQGTPSARTADAYSVVDVATALTQPRPSRGDHSSGGGDGVGASDSDWGAVTIVELDDSSKLGNGGTKALRVSGSVASDSVVVLEFRPSAR